MKEIALSMNTLLFFYALDKWSGTYGSRATHLTTAFTYRFDSRNVVFTQQLTVAA